PDPATPPPDTYALSLHDALPICKRKVVKRDRLDELQVRCPLFYRNENTQAALGKGYRIRQHAKHFRKGKRYQCKVRSFQTETKRSEEHTSELQSRENLVCRLLLE